MLPAIDMINHATEPDKRNTLLRKSSAELTVKVDGAPLTVHGFFTMKAGQLSQHQVWIFRLGQCGCGHALSAHILRVQFNVSSVDAFKDS